MTYTADFNQAVDFTLRAEGKLSNNPNDKGGLTKFGVTQARWLQYRAKAASLTGNSIASLPQSVSNITVDQAIEFYFTEFWTAPGIALLPRELQVPAFDFYVNSGDNAIESFPGWPESNIRRL